MCDRRRDRYSGGDSPEILRAEMKSALWDRPSGRRGNRERIAYVYDERAVSFTWLAAEAEPPRKRNPRTGESESSITWWRSTITSRGLMAPAAVRGLEHGSNLARNKRYDQILHLPRITDCFTDKAGVLDFYTGSHAQLMRGHTMSKPDFTYQLSDHLPLRAQLNTDTDDARLDQVIARSARRRRRRRG